MSMALENILNMICFKAIESDIIHQVQYMISVQMVQYVSLYFFAL